MSPAAKAFPLLSRPQLAEALGVHAVTISKWEAHDGLPTAVPGAPGKATQYRLADVLAWRLARERRPAPGDGEAPLDLETQRARLASAQAEHRETANRVRRGELLDVATQRAILLALFGTVLSRLRALPDALAARLDETARAGGPQAIRGVLAEAINGVCRDLASEATRQHVAERVMATITPGEDPA